VNLLKPEEDMWSCSGELDISRLGVSYVLLRGNKITRINNVYIKMEVVECEDSIFVTFSYTDQSRKGYLIENKTPVFRVLIAQEGVIY
jgi:hypothetical protein